MSPAKWRSDERQGWQRRRYRSNAKTASQSLTPRAEVAKQLVPLVQKAPSEVEQPFALGSKPLVPMAPPDNGDAKLRLERTDAI